MAAVASADLHQAIITVWNDTGIAFEFKKLWSPSVRDIYPALHELEATPQQPFPYAVFEQLPGTTVARMSGHTINEKHEIRDVPWDFRIHTKTRSGDVRTAKETAADLVDFILQKFGGHPTVPPPLVPELSNGSFLISQYQTDYSVRQGDEEWLWIVRYIFRLDVPVTA